MKKLNENFKVASLSSQNQDVYHFGNEIEENVLVVLNSDEDTQEATAPADEEDKNDIEKSNRDVKDDQPMKEA